MQNSIKKKNGVTMMTLVITIILIVVLSSIVFFVSISSGKYSINRAEETKKNISLQELKLRLNYEYLKKDKRHNNGDTIDLGNGYEAVKQNGKEYAIREKSTSKILEVVKESEI